MQRLSTVTKLSLACAAFALLLLAFAPEADAGRRRRVRRPVVTRHNWQRYVAPTKVKPSAQPLVDPATPPDQAFQAMGVQAMGIGDVSLSRAMTWVTDYGAIPGDGVDDSDAIIRCRQAALANGTYHVHFPAGEYTIEQTNVLHPCTNEDGSSETPFAIAGIQFSGEAQNHTILKLVRDAGTPIWFYDSDTLPGWNRAQFANLWFQSDAAHTASELADCNGFRVWATTDSGVATPTGWDKGFIFWQCRFNRLGTPQIHTGTSNTESFNYYSCWWSECGTYVWENDQSLHTAFYGCSFFTSFDAFRIEYDANEGAQSGGGAGQITFHNSTFIQYNIDGDTDAHYTLRIDDQADFFRVLAFESCRWEFRNPEARLLNWIGDTGVTNSHVAFIDCDMSQMQQSQSGIGGGGADTNGRRDIIALGPQKRAVFERCYFADQLGIAFSSVSTGTISGRAYQPIVEFIGCGLPAKFISGTNDAGSSLDATRGLTGRVTLSNGYGRVRAENCFIRDAGPGERFAVDFDYGGINATRGEPGIERKRVYLKTGEQAWPSWDTGVEQSERTILLPEGAKIVAAGIDKVAGGSAATEIQYRIGNDDRTVTYCATGTVRADGHHRAFNDESRSPSLFPVRVGSDLNLRRVRLWMGPVEHAGTSTDGEAWIEYE